VKKSLVIRHRTPGHLMDLASITCRHNNARFSLKSAPNRRNDRVLSSKYSFFFLSTAKGKARDAGGAGAVEHAQAGAARAMIGGCLSLCRARRCWDAMRPAASPGGPDVLIDLKPATRTVVRPPGTGYSQAGARRRGSGPAKRVCRRAGGAMTVVPRGAGLALFE
jgi:hypothetical protein